MLVMALIQFAKTFHWALVTAPLLVLGAHSRPIDDHRRTGSLLSIHAVGTLACCCGVVLLWPLISSDVSNVGAPLMAAAITTVIGVLSHELARKILQEKQLYRQLFANELALLAVLIPVLYLGLTNYPANPAAALMALASASVAAALFGLLQSGVAPRFSCTSLRTTATQHWNYGKWMVVTAVLLWMTERAQLVALSKVSTLTLVAGLSVALSLYGGANILFMGLESFTLPKGARLLALNDWQGLADLRRSLYRMSSIAVIISVIPVAALAPSLLGGLFGAEYVVFAFMVRWSALRYIAWVLVRPPMLMLQVLQRSRSVGLAYACSAFIVVVTVVPLVDRLGGVGACLSLVLGEIVLAIVATHECNKAISRREPLQAIA